MNNNHFFSQTDLTPYLEALHHAVFLLSSATNDVPWTVIPEDDWWEYNGDAHKVTFGS